MRNGAEPLNRRHRTYRTGEERLMQGVIQRLQTYKHTRIIDVHIYILEGFVFFLERIFKRHIFCQLYQKTNHAGNNKTVFKSTALNASLPNSNYNSGITPGVAG